MRLRLTRVVKAPARELRMLSRAGAFGVTRYIAACFGLWSIRTSSATDGFAVANVLVVASRDDGLVSIHSVAEEVREGETPSPAPETGALPDPIHLCLLVLIRGCSS